MILLDAIFTPLYLLMTLGSLIVSRIVAKGPSRAFPFARHALAPIFVSGQAIILTGALAYVILEAVRVILEGGSTVSGLSLLGYGVFSALVCLITWRVLLRMAPDRPLVEAEAAGWFSSVPSSAAVALGGVVVLLLGTRSAVAPYVDPALVIIVSLGLLVIPVNLLRRSLATCKPRRPLRNSWPRWRPWSRMSAQLRVCPNPYSGPDGSARYWTSRWRSYCHQAPETSPPKTGFAARCATDSVTCPTACGSPWSSAMTPSFSMVRFDPDWPVGSQ